MRIGLLVVLILYSGSAYAQRIVQPFSVPPAQYTLAAGGVPQNLTTTAISGGWLCNGTATDEGISTAETIYWSTDGNAPNTGIYGNGNALVPGSCVQLLPSGEPIIWVAATTNHRVGITVWQ